MNSTKAWQRFRRPDCDAVSLAKDIQKACIEAAEQCPQFRFFDGDQCELVGGKSIRPAKLHKKGVLAVVRYWRDKNTIGGSVLWEKGYSAALPEYVLNGFRRVDDEIEKALLRAFS